MNSVFGRIALMCTVIIVATSLPARVLAAPSPSPSQGLEISPPVIDLPLAGQVINPGQTVVAKIRLRNVTRGDLVVNGKADDFGAKGESGEPQLLLDETDATRYSLKFWIASVPSFRLAPQEVKTAEVPIVIPANAEPGGHYGVIRFTGVPPELEGTGVSLSASIGTLVLLRINGAINDSLKTTEMYVSHPMEHTDGSPTSYVRGTFFENGPLVLTERLHNDGSVHEKPVGTVSVKNMFGKTIAKLPFADPARNILPDSTRKFEQTLSQVHLFGRYTVQLSATYASHKTLSSVTSFWVIPWNLIILILLMLIAAYFGSRYALKRYNRYIIAQARRR